MFELEYMNRLENKLNRILTYKEIKNYNYNIDYSNNPIFATDINRLYYIEGKSIRAKIVINKFKSYIDNPSDFDDIKSETGIFSTTELSNILDCFEGNFQLSSKNGLLLLYNSDLIAIIKNIGG